MKKALTIVIIIWTVYLANLIYFKHQVLDLQAWGCIEPRNFHKFYAIFTAPFLHANIDHLLANTLSIFILSWTLFVFYPRQALMIFVIILVLSGLGIWLLGASGTCHLGISGIIFGLITFFIFNGIFRLTFKALFIAVAIGFLYGGALIAGILTTNPHISIIGHISGAVSGFLTALLFAKNKN